MRTIIYIIPSLRKSGPVNVLLSQCTCIDRSKYIPVIITLFEEDNFRSIKDLFIREGVKVISLNLTKTRLLMSLTTITTKIKRICQKEYDPILHAHCLLPTLIISGIKDYPTMTTIHNISKIDYPLVYGNFLGQIFDYLFRNSLTKISKSVAISKEMACFYHRYSSDLSIIYNGVLTKNVSIIKHQFRTSHCMCQNDKLILVTGQIHTRKNTSFIVKELKSLKRRDFKVFFLGMGDKLDECRDLAGDDNRFRFEGFVNNVEEYIECADLFISASLSEGMPMAVLEAVCKGVPTLLSNIGPHKEIVDCLNIKGVANFDLAQGSLSKIVDAYLDSVFDKNNIENRANSKFSAQVMQKSYEELYSSL